MFSQAASSAASDIPAASLRRTHTEDDASVCRVKSGSVGTAQNAAATPDRRAPSSSCRLSCACLPCGGLGPRVSHSPVERVVRHLFPAVLGEGVVGAVGVLPKLGERACLL